MKKTAEYRIICEGNYSNISEAKHALQDSFIEDYVEETGRFRYQDLENIRVTNKISLADLEIEEIDEGVFEVSCPNAQVFLNKPKAEKLAETLRQQAMFDEIYIETIGE